MKTTLVSLISQQTIPNVQLILEFKDKVDNYLFVTTKEMEAVHENRSDWIINASGISPAKVNRLVVNPASITEINEALLKYGLNDEDEFIVNITCGTKIMSIAVMNFFQILSNSQIIYSYIDHPRYEIIFPGKDNNLFEYTHNLTLWQYLSSHDLSIEQKENLTHNHHEIIELFKKVVNYRSDFTKIPEINNAHRFNSASEKDFYSGGWFEEYIYIAVKKHFALKDTEIAMKINLKNRKTRNEYDVIFIRNNTLYVIECKAYSGLSNIKKKIEEGIYKLAALDNDFGLSAKSVFITTFDIKRNLKFSNRTLLNRASDVGVQLFQFDDLLNNNFLNKLENGT